jgi:hypothetical protein
MEEPDRSGGKIRMIEHSKRLERGRESNDVMVAMML